MRGRVDIREASARLRETPVAVAFLVLLALTTGVLAGAGPEAQQKLLQGSSTNLTHLSQVPVRVLVASVLWVGPGGLLTMVLPTALLMASVERRIGSGRTLLVFAAGHLGATLLTAAGIWAGIHAGTLAPSVGDSVDVGVSYGTFALAAYAMFLLEGRMRAAGLGALGLALAWHVWTGRTFTDFGHLFALAIGVTLALAGVGLPRRRRLAPALGVALVLAAGAPAAGLVELPAPRAPAKIVKVVRSATSLLAQRPAHAARRGEVRKPPA